VGVLAWFRREKQWRRDHIAAFSAVTQKQSDGLTAFQHQALAAVARSVAAEHFKRIAMSDGSGEYLVASLGSRGSDLYIYPNEAGIFGAKPHCWFEEWDYLTPKELLDALAKECASRAA
jgi:hypothetical protein